MKTSRKKYDIKKFLENALSEHYSYAFLEDKNVSEIFNRKQISQISSLLQISRILYLLEACIQNLCLT